MNQTQTQQGDVLLRKLSCLPKGTKTILQTKTCILARGEHGNSHVIEDEEAELIQIGEKILLQLKNTAILKHEEHKQIVLEPGIWEVGQVREYDYFKQMERKVQD
ncbi:MAG: hypothetical protein AABY22_13420 [Nanoarchaeota archaeon]